MTFSVATANPYDNLIGEGRIHRELGDMRNALTSFERAKQMDATQVTAYVEIAQTLRRMDESKYCEQIVTNYRKAASIEPNNALYHSNLGIFLSTMAENDAKFATEAEQELKEALRLQPNYPVTSAELALLLSETLSKHDEALQHIDNAIRGDSNPQYRQFKSEIIQRKQQQRQ